MDWVETGPGSFVKDMDGIERIYRTISQSFKALGHENGGVYCTCTLEFGGSFRNQDNTIALRNAWKALRFDYPGLAVIPEGLNRKSYVLPNETSVEQWTEETFFVEKTADYDSILANYPLRDLPSLYFFPASSRILYLDSHWRIDGLGVCMLLNRFFSLLAAGTASPSTGMWVNDVDKISPSIEDAAGTPRTVDPKLDAFARAYIDHHHRNAVHVGGLPYNGDNKTGPGKMARTALVFDETSSVGLVAACKETGISVTAAIYAALAETMFGVLFSADKYAAVMSLNMRNHLPHPYNTRDHAVQTYVRGITPSVSREDDFYQKARQLTAFYKEGNSEDFMRAFRLTAQYHADELFKPRPHGTPPPSNIHLSSLGVVENHLERQHGNAIQVADFQLGVNMMTRQVAIYIWTFDRRFNISLVYNDAYYHDSEMRNFLDSIMNVVKKEMGIAMELDLGIESTNGSG